MPVDAAQLLVRVSADTKGAETGLKSINDNVKESGSRWKEALSHVLEFAGAGVLMEGFGGIMEGVKDQVVDMVKEGMSANQVIANTAAVLKSTKDASGETAASIADFATHMSNLTGIDDDAVQGAENMLLTFTNIGKKVFPDTTEAVMNMATSMNGGAIPSAEQLRQTAIQVGKALNDPIQGVSALQRVGVKLTATEKEQVATMMAHNNIAGAQAIILKELNSEFGGQAEAAGKANGGLAILNAQMNNVKETIGQAIIPLLVDFMNAITPITSEFANDLPGAIQATQGFLHGVSTVFGNVAQIMQHSLQPSLDFAGRLFKQMGDAISGVGNAFSSSNLNGLLSGLYQVVGQVGQVLNILITQGLDVLSTVFTDMAPVVQQVWAHLQGLGNVISANLLPALQSFLPSMQDLQGITDQVGPLIDQLAPLIGNLASEIADQLGTAIKIVSPLLKQTGELFKNTIMPTVMALLPHIINLASVFVGQVEPALAIVFTALLRLWTVIQSAFIPVAQRLIPIIGQIAGFLMDNLGKALTWLMPQITQAAGHVTTFANELSTRLGPAISTIFDFIGVALHILQDLWNAIWPALSRVLQDVWNVIKGIIEIGWSIISGIIKVGLDILGGKWSKAWDDLKNMLGGVWDGIKKVVSGALHGLWDSITGIMTGWLPGMLKAGQDLIQHLIDGIKSMAGNLASAAGNAIRGALSNIPGVGGLLSHLPHFASGGTMGTSGIAVVGEAGPELVKLPAGAQVYSASQTAGMFSHAAPMVGRSAQPVVINVHVAGQHVAQALLPDITDAIRQVTGNRVF